MAGRLDARGLIAVLIDAGSWCSWDLPVPDEHPDEYAEELRSVRALTGYDESVVSGSAAIGGHRIAIIASEFGFMGGSIGVAAGRRTVDAIRRATREGLPILALPTSGGTRMQEGTSAFVLMVSITAAVQSHKAAGLLYLVYLRHPTTGGVLASWGSLGHVTFAEPNSLVGFVGPRVYEAMTGSPFPTEVQTGENLCDHGIVDSVVPTCNLAGEVSAVLDTLAHAVPLADAAPIRADGYSSRTSWDRVQVSRNPQRPGVRDLLSDSRVRHTRLNGSGETAADDCAVVALARICGHPCVLIGHDRDVPCAISADGLRAARRGIRLATELGVPLVTVIDTAGAELSKDAEENGIAGQIARCLAEIISVPVPTVSVLLGQGSGGAALAFFPADRMISAENGWLSPLPPEGASVIVYRDVEHAAEMATRQRVGSIELAESGLIDIVISESRDAADDPALFVHRVIETLSAELSTVARTDTDTRLRDRLKRYDRAVPSAPTRAGR
ncbi:acetyl-CoA carboxyl transferase [Rhodococcus sp. BP-252]|uniref:carboxyl transferase domain-containing protein n=1 Tax=unclassified Rhodococcus (in: high G+C Gram-positive bacteria) TaxID=192944 RepID=UPI001C9A78AC|nr:MULTISPECIES: carboxyl transferase domain-containing protein [unclassified Rhodococcus (in: high G+C Gram-positive bacteria)]MBY6414660.1 acetyl-CoA carboxyl transferase [Rhodococcus sp. BP-320]MBY6419485.1 acetyl-CoA carboxyl transferase [Rhodococcus sp. BP-321]MBY6424503.1 acetyl-CoA carboxyl transferase [Rhodococcus sp. BP-324]MBY6429496.1 acetyl-CoA carboxyl transferase [Rhodococcus sp. BP-323]MBY6434513.1 acetyl-CoA carboxyl transferase [Rhodococcus sp. BP-322]